MKMVSCYAKCGVIERLHGAVPNILQRSHRWRFLNERALACPMFLVSCGFDEWKSLGACFGASLIKQHTTELSTDMDGFSQLWSPETLHPVLGQLVSGAGHWLLSTRWNLHVFLSVEHLPGPLRLAAAGICFPGLSHWLFKWQLPSHIAACLPGHLSALSLYPTPQYPCRTWAVC